MTLVQPENSAAGATPVANIKTTQIVPFITPVDENNIYDIKGIS